jgi:hypothetical protein
VKVDLAEFLNELEKAIGFVELLDLLIEGEVFEKGADFRGEAVNVVEQILREPVGVGLEALEIVLAGVVELVFGRALQHFVRVFGGLALEPLVLFEDFGLGGIEDAIEAAEHRHGQHDFAVFGRAVRAAEKVSDIPDEAD